MKIYTKKVIILILGTLVMAGLFYLYTSKNVIYERVSDDIPNDVRVIKINKNGDIPELGINITFAKELSDTIYTYNEDTGSVSFSTESLLRLDSEYCSPEYRPLGSISKVMKTELREGSIDRLGSIEDMRVLTTYEPPLAKEFDEYFIYYDGPQAQCTEAGSDTTLQGKQKDLLEAAINTIEQLE